MHTMLFSIVPLRSREARTLWPLLVIGASALLSVTLTCIAPLVAMALLTSRTLSFRHALATTLGAVAVNQAIGFAFLGYPHTLATAQWAAYFGLATMAAFATARRVPNLALAAIGSFAAFQGVLAAFSIVVEHSLADYTPSIVGHVALANIEGLGLLGLVYAALVAIERFAPTRAQAPLQR